MAVCVFFAMKKKRISSWHDIISGKCKNDCGEKLLKNAEMKITRWPYLVAGVVMMFLAGIIYAWSILKVPLATEFGWNDMQLGLNFTLTMCGFCIGGIFGGIILKRLSPQITVILSGVLTFCGFFGSSQLSGVVVFLYIFYGMSAGIGIGIMYNVVVTSITKWFPDKHATASGALMMGFGASPLILGPVINELINTSGWRNAYFLFGLAVAVVLIIGSFFLKPPDARVNSLVATGSKSVNEEGTDLTTKEMVKKSSFWKYYCLLLLLSAIGTVIISLLRDVSISVGTTESLAVLLVGVLSVCNGIGRIIAGFLFDNIGRRNAMLLANGFYIIACMIMLVAVLTSSTPFLVVGLILTGLTYGTLPPTASGVIKSFYGSKNFALNFSMINTMLIPASFGATIAGAIIGATASFTPVFIMLLCFSIVAFCINITLKKA